MNIIYFLTRQMMYFAIPLLVVAIGGMFSERSGVINIALEGIMLVGAFFSIFFINLIQSSDLNLHGQLLLLLAIIISMVFGMIFSLFHAYASISLKADQTISGTALNMIAPALAIYIARTLQPNGVQQVPFKNEFMIDKVPFLGDIPILGELFFRRVYITTYIGLIILFISAFVLYKTKFGLRLRSCGEHPQAADSVGINVYKTRYLGVLISGMLAGFGGLVFIIPTTVEFNADVGGYGFLALAVLIFGQWKPFRILFAAFFFGFMKVIATGYAAVPFLVSLAIPSDIFKMIPFISTLIILVFSSKKSQAPKASGVPYDKSLK